jgi:acyl-coenzyme A synthetase/AMP-(fatty) acid ligase
MADSAARFDEALGAHPARPFLHDGPDRGAIHALAVRLRDALAARAAPDRPVCLVTEDRAITAAALLASLGGGPPLIVPHASTPAVLDDVRRAVPFATMLTDAPREPPRGCEVVVAGRPEPAQGDRIRVVRPPDEPFVHLYTGGSTGKPRAWSKTPANLLGEALLLARRFAITPDDRLLATVPPCHIYGLLFSTLVPLVSGASVVGETVFLPAAVAETAANARCSALISVPAHFRALARTSWGAARLRLAFSSTAPLDERDAAGFTTATGAGVHEVYGSTETGGIALRCRATGEASWTLLDGVRWKIVDGRLCVASPFLSPDLPRDADGFFRTADRATKAAAGFELAGRADGVVKVGGKRVDLGEVEERLQAVPGVREAWVWSRAAERGRGREIVALIVGDAAEDEVLARLRDVLPAPAMPRRIRRVEHLPLTPTGKRDLAAAEQLLVMA